VGTTIIQVLRDVVGNNLADPTRQEPAILVMPADYGAFKAHEVEIMGPSKIVMLPPGSPEVAGLRMCSSRYVPDPRKYPPLRLDPETPYERSEP
jgi:hypothetical protein